MKDYSVQLKVRNNWLLTRMRAAGIETVADLARAAGVNYQNAVNLMNLKTTGMSSYETWRPIVLKISEFLKCLPEDIIPPQHVHSVLSKNVAEVELDVDQVKAIMASGGAAALPDTDMRRREATEQIDRALATLTPRQEAAIRLRLLSDDPDVTLLELSEKLGVSPERARQIELTALHKLRHPSRARLFGLREILEDGDTTT